MIKLFDIWETGHIVVADPGLREYINLSPIIVPKTGGRNSKVRFHKSKTTIVERFLNKLMGPGHRGKKHKITSGFCGGKSQTTLAILKKAFQIIEEKTKKNPVEVFIKALENAAPREEITSIEYGGARYSQAVECAPQRRIDIVLRMMTQGAFQASHNSKKKIENCLADEIILAYNMDQKSVALAKKLELERQADSSR